MKNIGVRHLEPQYPQISRFIQIERQIDIIVCLFFEFEKFLTLGIFLAEMFEIQCFSVMVLAVKNLMNKLHGTTRDKPMENVTVCHLRAIIFMFFFLFSLLLSTCDIVFVSISPHTELLLLSV